MKLRQAVCPCVSVIARSRAGLVSALRLEFGNRLRVRHHEALPCYDPFETVHILLVDLEDLANSIEPRSLLPVVARHDVWLITGDGYVSSPWLEVARYCCSQVIHCSASERDSGFPRVTTRLYQQLDNLKGNRISELVVRHEPALAAVQPLVEALCERPWEIRRPRELEAALGMTHHRLKRQVRAIGFGRVEHLMTHVRVVALEQLMASWHLSPSVARRLIGITDLSNMRRQVARATRGSSHSTPNADS